MYSNPLINLTASSLQLGMLIWKVSSSGREFCIDCKILQAISYDSANSGPMIHNPSLSEARAHP